MNLYVQHSHNCLYICNRKERDMCKHWNLVLLFHFCVQIVLCTVKISEHKVQIHKSVCTERHFWNKKKLLIDLMTKKCEYQVIGQIYSTIRHKTRVNRGNFYFLMLINWLNMHEFAYLWRYKVTRTLFYRNLASKRMWHFLPVPLQAT